MLKSQVTTEHKDHFQRMSTELSVRMTCNVNLYTPSSLFFLYGGMIRLARIFRDYSLFNFSSWGMEYVLFGEYMFISAFFATHLVTVWKTLK